MPQRYEKKCKYAIKSAENSFFVTKRRGKIWKFEKFVVSLQKILKHNLKPERTMKVKWTSLVDDAAGHVDSRLTDVCATM